MKSGNFVDYSQPDAYHFSEDSILLAKLAMSHPHTRKLNLKWVLDLCAGCGVVGIEFLLSYKESCSLDFVEEQEIFSAHIDQNVKNLIPIERQPLIRKIIASFSSFTSLVEYDLILCNPPYYFRGEGRLPPDPIKEKCHFIERADYIHLVQKLAHLLSKDGIAFFLSRQKNGAEVPQFINEIQSWISGYCCAYEGTFKGASLFSIKRLNID